MIETRLCKLLYIHLHIYMRNYLHYTKNGIAAIYWVVNPLNFEGNKNDIPTILPLFQLQKHFSSSYKCFVFLYVGSAVIWLSLGKLLVNLLQVVKRTNTPLIPQQMASSAGHGFFGSWVQIPRPPYKLFRTFRMSNLKNTLLVYPGNETSWIIDRSAGISGRPAIPPFQGGRVLLGLVWVSYWLTFCKW